MYRGLVGSEMCIRDRARAKETQKASREVVGCNSFPALLVVGAKGANIPLVALVVFGLTILSTICFNPKRNSLSGSNLTERARAATSGGISKLW